MNVENTKKEKGKEENFKKTGDIIDHVGDMECSLSCGREMGKVTFVI
jgi:hypothetical protein